MKPYVYITRGLLVFLPLLALLSFGRIVVDWVQFSQVSGPFVEAPARSFDGVLWQEDDGNITASYVFPGSPADRAGLENGDVFYMLEYQQYFNAEDLQRAVEGIPPGETRTYYVRRGGQFGEAAVTFTRYPTFLYPLSSTLWYYSVWGFTLGAFLHLLGLIITAPLARRSRKARFSLTLILVSSLWFFGNMIRLLLVELFGTPPPTGSYATIFQGFTFIGLVGWIGFPALLVHKVVVDTHEALRLHVGRMSGLLYIPAVVLGLAALVAAVFGSLGPLTLDSLVAPILFYACCYIAVAAGLVLLYYLLGLDAKAQLPGGWNRIGSALLFVGALLLALSVQGIVPLFGVVNDTMAGWLVVSAQLLSIVPIALVTLATLRSGKVGQVFSRTLVYLTTLGFIFFAFVGGMAIIDLYLDHATVSHNVVSGLYVILLLVLFERLARKAHIYASHLFATDRQQARKTLVNFQEQMRSILDHQTLARRTVTVVGEALKVRSARIFLHQHAQDEQWITGVYHPEPPYLTERIVEHIWPYMKREGRIWADNPELNESSLPEPRARMLKDRGAALALPIMGDGEPIGLLVLGPKLQRRAVFNLADLDLLRSLSGQLALAVERLNLVEREKLLARESAEAELVALRAQINPHFLFNALNTIIALIADRPEKAEETVEHLAAIFRHTLHTGSRPFVPLEEEFTLIDHYLQIEQVRFGEKLEVHLDLPEALSDRPVPAFAIQTLVENAVKHGIAHKRGGGEVRVTARETDDGDVNLRVYDSGSGIPSLFDKAQYDESQSQIFGIGLQNVASRLEQLYARSDLLQIESDPDEGTTAQITLPRSAPSSNEVLALEGEQESPSVTSSTVPSNS